VPAVATKPAIVAPTAWAAFHPVDPNFLMNISLQAP
jgi:hypothetical protein